jgi:hypothetical protein
VERVGRSRTAELVMIIGEPGLGKTRLLAELRDATGDGVRWLTGTCVPYGEDATLRPLVDLVRAEAGVVSGADPADAREGVAALAHRVAADEGDRAWLRGGVRPCPVGRRGDGAGRRVDRGPPLG